jgi:hypothetical protein
MMDRIKNVFVLGTGRCGTTTFMKACRHVRNFTTAHELRVNAIGDLRLDYPANHIEADNRLSWFLGRLEERYGNDAFYVHMQRSEDAVARSYLKRWKSDHSIIYGYRTAIIPRPDPELPPLEVVRDMCHTINANIRTFMRDKTHTEIVNLETAEEDFARVWDRVGFEGERDAALGEWRITYNASREETQRGSSKLRRIPAKLGRIIEKLPDFLDRA